MNVQTLSADELRAWFPTIFNANSRGSVFNSVRVKSGSWSRALLNHSRIQGRLALKVFLSSATELNFALVRELATYALIHRVFRGNVRDMLRSGLNVASEVMLLTDATCALVPVERGVCTPAVMRMPLFDASVHELIPILDRNLLKLVGYKTLKAVATLHSLGIMHRDVKPGNILVSNDGKVVLTDFGMSKWAEIGSSMRTEDLEGPGHTPGARILDQYSTEVFTLGYRPPEVLMNAPYGFPADVWAVGMSLLHMASGNYNGKHTEYETLLEIFGLLGSEYWCARADREPFPFPRWTASACLPKLKRWSGTLADDGAAMDLVRRLLEPNPEARITAAEALQHPWFADLATHSRDEPSVPPLEHQGWPTPSVDTACPNPINAVIFKCIDEGLMSVAAAYLVQDFVVATPPRDLVSMIACVVLAITLVDSAPPNPKSIWNAAIAAGSVNDGEDTHMDCDTLNLSVLKCANEIMARRKCDMWIKTLCSQPPRVQQHPLWKRLIRDLLKHTPLAHPLLRGPGVLDFMDQLTRTEVPDAKHYQTFIYTINILGKDCDPELLRIYTAFVHTHFVRSCQSIMAALPAH
jgi:serine/threonine protein kinase